MGNVLRKTMWVGRTASAVFGLALVLALVFGVATSALGANGKPFLLGKKNVATAVSTLIKKGPGPALKLQVAAGQPPIAVNSQAKVAKLNADRLDGKDSSGFYAAGSKGADASHADQADAVDGKSANEIGVNGLERVAASSSNTSDSPKSASASCPVGKKVVGTGYVIDGGKTGVAPNQETDVVVDDINPGLMIVSVTAYEEEPNSSNWSVGAIAFCATAP